MISALGLTVIAISGFQINSLVGIVLMRTDMVIVIVPIVALYRGKCFRSISFQYCDLSNFEKFYQMFEFQQHKMAILRK